MGVQATSSTADAVERAFSSVVSARRSVRKYTPNPLPAELIQKVLTDAQCAPSNVNSQPWVVHILSGASRDAFCAKALESLAAGKMAGDFSFALTDYDGIFLERAQAQGKSFGDAMGIGRDMAELRMDNMRRNLVLYDAPHVALLFMPMAGDNVRVAADVGMYAQTFLLSLVAHGAAGLPSTLLGYFPDAAREVTGVPETYKLLFGIAFGYPEAGHPMSEYITGRAPVSESVTFHD